MEALSHFLVQQPLHILGVAGIFFLAWVLLKPRKHLLLVPAMAWLCYAGWEWIVLVQTPEADIRVDLLLIWPLVLMAMLWPIFRAFFPGRSASPESDNGNSQA
jgi:hypothetical protein